MSLLACTRRLLSIPRGKATRAILFDLRQFGKSSLSQRPNFWKLPPCALNGLLNRQTAAFSTTKSSVTDNDDSDTPTDTSSIDLAGFYRVEVSNSDEGAQSKGGSTKLIVEGPSFNGLLGYILDFLSDRGWNVVSVDTSQEGPHQVFSSIGVLPTRSESHSFVEYIHDVFYIVDSKTGQPLSEDQMSDLANLLVFKALRKPPWERMGGGMVEHKETIRTLSRRPNFPSLGEMKECIAILPSSTASRE